MVGKQVAAIFGIAVLMGLRTSAAAEQQKRYPLRDLIAVGDRCLIDSSSDTSLKIVPRSGDQEAPPIEASTRFRETYVEEVLAMKGGAVTRLRQQYLSAGTVSTDPQGNRLAEPSPLQGKTVTLERKGNRTVIAPASLKLDADDRTRLLRALDQVGVPLLPNRAVAVGEEWTVATPKVKVFFAQARTGTLRAHFQEVTTYAGEECAHVHLNGELELAIGGLPVPAKAQVTGDVYYALGIQRAVAVEFDGPLSLNGQTQQDGRSVSLTGEGRMQAKIRIQWQKLGGRAVLVPKAWGKSSATPVAPEQPGALRYGALGVQLPGAGWKVLRYDPAARRLDLALPGQGRMRGVSIWPVAVPAAERSRSQPEHAAAYFASERRMERPDGPWTGLQEGERAIDGRRYPTMSFQFHPNASERHVMDGLFLVYFPADFAQRQHYFVLMWSDLHPKDEPAHGMEDLDTVVRTLQVR